MITLSRCQMQSILCHFSKFKLQSLNHSPTHALRGEGGLFQRRVRGRACCCVTRSFNAFSGVLLVLNMCALSATMHVLPTYQSSLTKIMNWLELLIQWGMNGIYNSIINS